MKRILGWILFSLAFVGQVSLAQESELTFKTKVYKNPPHSFSKAVKVAAPSVVNIYTVRSAAPSTKSRRSKVAIQAAKPRKFRYRLGSGVVMDRQGYILSNFHVVANARVILVALADGRKARAKIIGKDRETDLAVLQVPLRKLTPITLGNSEKIEVGDVVLAIGNPFGLGQTVTQGIISAIGRNTIGINQLENYIQTDAAINPGNSGGALVNTRGHLIGINVGIYSRSGGYQGVGFAIPVNVALNIMRQIIKYGRVERGYMGVNVVTLTINIARQLKIARSTGVVVTRVLPNSPAAKAGLKINDVIYYINQYRIRSSRGFLNYIAQREPGTNLRLRVIRKGKPGIMNVRAGVRPPPPALDDRGRPSSPDSRGDIPDRIG